MKKVPLRRIAGVFLMLVSALFLIWLLWPRTFSQIIPGYGRKDLQQLHATLFNMEHDDNRSISFDPSSPKAVELLDLLQRTRYQRILTCKQWREISLPYEVHLTFVLGEEDDQSIHCLSIIGDPLMEVHGSNTPNRTYSAYGGEEFQQSVLDFLLEQDWEPVPNS